MKLCLALSDVEDTAETNCQLRPGLGQGLSHTSHEVLLSYQCRMMIGVTNDNKM